jgi:hypothetical protein
VVHEVRTTFQGLRALLGDLAAGSTQPAGCYGQWQVTPVTGGANNRLFHARGLAGDLAIKFTLRDRRMRANREHAALQALDQAGLRIAPRPIMLDTARYEHPVVVQEWLEGPVSPTPPEDEASWHTLVDHFLAVHTVKPGNSAIRLRKAVLNFSSARQGVQVVTRMAARLPPTAHPEGLRELVQRLGAAHFHSWKIPQPSLCRTDPAPLNFIRRPGMWA